MSDEQRVPQLLPESDPLDLARSPAEGFLLSRIDGYTPWSVLRHIGGLSPDEVDACLWRWLDEGHVACAGEDESKPDAAVAEPAAAEPADPDVEAFVVPGLDISADRQRQILRFEASLDRSYWALLGVGPDDDERAIKRAYFKLSKQYHPDRYYRREIGEFGGRLERIFKKLVEAYELLSDPGTRAELQRSMGAVDPAGAPAPRETPEELPPRGAGVPESTPTAPSKRDRQRQALDRLRKHFQIPEGVLAERRFRARQFFRSARLAVHRKSWMEAASSARLAIAFDPWNPEFKEGFADILAEVHKFRAEELLERARLDSNGSVEALHLYEEALTFRPCDPEVNDRAAQVALEANDLEKGREYAETACELAPEVAGYHLTRARVLRTAGSYDKAKEALDEAFRLDQKLPGVVEELERLRPKKRRR